MPVGVVDGVPPVGCSVTASVGVGLPVGSTILSLLVVLAAVKMCEVHTGHIARPFYKGHITKSYYRCCEVCLLPVVAVPVGVVDGVPPLGCSVTASVGVGLPVGCTVLVLLVVLVPVKVCKIRTYCTYNMGWPFCKGLYCNSYCRYCAIGLLLHLLVLCWWK